MGATSGSGIYTSQPLPVNNSGNPSATPYYRPVTPLILRDGQSICHAHGTAVEVVSIPTMNRINGAIASFASYGYVVRPSPRRMTAHISYLLHQTTSSFRSVNIIICFQVVLVKLPSHWHVEVCREEVVKYATGIASEHSSGDHQ